MTCQDLRTPGRAVRALAEEKGWSRDELASRLSYTPYLTQKLIDDEVRITTDIAKHLSEVLGRPLQQWLALEAELEQSRSTVVPPRN